MGTSESSFIHTLCQQGAHSPSVSMSHPAPHRLNSLPGFSVLPSPQRALCALVTLLSDSSFPPSDSSLGTQPRLGLRWQKATELAPHSAFLSKPLQVTSKLRSTFISTVSLLCECQLLGRQFQTRSLSKNGLYLFNLLVNGIVQEVMVDEFIPVNLERRPVFAEFEGQQEAIFAMMMEKAVAKAHGSYYSMTQLNCYQLLRTLTLCPVLVLPLKGMSPHQIYSQASKKKSLLVTQNTGGENGLPPNALFRVELTPDTTRMFNKEVGHFQLTYLELQQNFSHIFICQTFYQHYRFLRPQAGSSGAYFQFRLESQTQVCLVASRQQFKQQQQSQPVSIRLILGQLRTDREVWYVDSVFQRSHEAALSADLKPSTYLLHCKASSTQALVLSLYSSQEIHSLEEVPAPRQDFFSQVLYSYSQQFGEKHSLGQQKDCTWVCSSVQAGLAVLAGSLGRARLLTVELDGRFLASQGVECGRTVLRLSAERDRGALVFECERNEWLQFPGQVQIKCEYNQ